MIPSGDVGRGHPSVNLKGQHSLPALHGAPECAPSEQMVHPGSEVGVWEGAERL